MFTRREDETSLVIIAEMNSLGHLAENASKLSRLQADPNFR